MQISPSRATTGPTRVHPRADEITLPSPGGSTARPNMPGSQTQAVPPSTVKKGVGSTLRWLTVVGAVAVASWASWQLMKDAGTAEQQHDNWQHVEAANKQSESMGRDAMTLLDSTGKVLPVVVVGLSEADWDQPTSQAVQQAIQTDAETSLAEIVETAQQIPEVTDAKTGTPLPFRRPELTAGMRSELVTGDSAFFHLFVYDSCAEDGDVVEIYINDISFAVVPITNAGATLSVPFLPGVSNSIALKGIRDGGGGITVAFESSQGHHFCRAMLEDEMQQLGVVVQ